MSFPVDPNTPPVDANASFWSEYYKNDTNTTQPSPFAISVYNEYIKSYNQAGVFLKIADLGCGNCRDSTYFAQQGNMCYAIDINCMVKSTHPYCEIIKKDVDEVLETNTLMTMTDVVYMRWFLHAMPYSKAQGVFTNATNILKPNGLICVEVRSLNDEELIKSSKYNSDESYETTHKRWLYNTQMLTDMAAKNKYEVVYIKEDYFSPSTEAETKNPLLIRMILRKQVLPYFEQSENYNLYKHITPPMKSRTMRSYEELDIFNSILEKHKINYVAVAGTLLGLNRHGGIIPWDNDIDIGFTRREWSKFILLKSEFEAAGLAYRYFYDEFIRFGEIDCFKLDLKQDSYDGKYGRTSCGVQEYKNVRKQLFGYSYVYAPFCSKQTLSRRYGNYFYEGDVNDNFHFKDNTVQRFALNAYDRSYQVKDVMSDS